MAILMFVARIHHLTSSINKHQARLMEITRRISDLQDYAASIMDGVSMEDMMNTPASMFGRMFTFSGFSHNQAMMNAQQQFSNPDFQAMLSVQMQNIQDPQTQQAYMNWVQQSLYKQAREQINKQEARLLNQQEKQLTQEKEKLEAIIKMEEADLESAKKARDKGIEQMAPKYVA